MTTLRELRGQHGMSLAELARRLGVTRATVQGYERRDEAGVIQQDTRRRVLAALGAEEASLSADQARSLLLHTAIAAKLLVEPASMLELAHDNLRRWGRGSRHDRAWLERWQRVLKLSPAQIAMVLTERSQDASDLRQGSPFAGALTDEHRAAIIERSRELDPGLSA